MDVRVLIGVQMRSIYPLRVSLHVTLVSSQPNVPSINKPRTKKGILERASSQTSCKIDLWAAISFSV
jgi:hypothetical protein